VKLTWADNAGNESGYIIERSADGLNWTQIALTGANSTSYIDSTSAKRNATWSYRVSAYNDAGRSAASNVARF
jgi:hypothetical protein